MRTNTSKPHIAWGLHTSIYPVLPFCSPKWAKKQDIQGVDGAFFSYFCQLLIVTSYPYDPHRPSSERPRPHPYCGRRCHTHLQAPWPALGAGLHCGRLPGRAAHALHSFGGGHDVYQYVVRNRRHLPHVHARTGIFVQEDSQDGRGSRGGSLHDYRLHDGHRQRTGAPDGLVGDE